MKYISIILFASVLACKKEDNSRKDFGCVYGTVKATGEYVYIKCTHEMMALAGNNQAAADKIAEKYGLPKENVAYMESYTGIKFVPNPDCDCGN